VKKKMNTQKSERGKGGEEKRKWTVPASKAGKTWTVQTHKKYGLSCNCPSWIYRLNKGERGCKHTRMIAEQIGGTPVF